MLLDFISITRQYILKETLFFNDVPCVIDLIGSETSYRASLYKDKKKKKKSHVQVVHLKIPTEVGSHKE